MKIIHMGKKPTEVYPPLLWELDAYHKCGNCETVYELEESDTRNVTDAPSRRGGRGSCFTNCPVCKTEVETKYVAPSGLLWPIHKLRAVS